MIEQDTIFAFPMALLIPGIPCKEKNVYKGRFAEESCTYKCCIWQRRKITDTNQIQASSHLAPTQLADFTFSFEVSLPNCNSFPLLAIYT